MRRFVAVALVGLCVACGVSPAQKLRDTISTIDKTQSHPHAFVYTDDTLDGSQKITVQGKVQDDLRYEGTVIMNGKPLYAMIVSDDAVALHLIDRQATKSVIAFAKASDEVTGKALEAGQWVVDFTAAPPLKVVSAAEGSTGSGTASNLAASQDQVGNDPFFDAADALHYTERNMASGLGVNEFNPDDVTYNPADDPWRSDAKLNLRNQGIRRYDLGQPGLPTRASRGQVQSLPTVSDFRKMVIYIKGTRTIAVKEQISIRDRKEFRRAGVGRAAKFYLELRDAALGGAIQSALRQREMSYSVEPYNGGDIELPRDAVRGILKDVIGDQGLKTLFKFTIIGGRSNSGPGVLPGIGNGTLPTPGTSSTPSTSPSVSPKGSPKVSSTPAASASP